MPGRAINKFTPAENLARFGAAWSADEPQSIVFDWMGLPDQQDSCVVELLSKERMNVLTNTSVLDISYKTPYFYQPEFDANLSNPELQEVPFSETENGLRYRLELWTNTDEFIHELSEVLFAGRSGMLRVLLWNITDEPIAVFPALLQFEGPIQVESPQQKIWISPGEEKEVLYKLSVPESAKADYFTGNLVLNLENQSPCIAETFNIGIYRLLEFDRQISTLFDQTTIKMKFSGVVETPFGFTEALSFEQFIQINTRESAFVCSSGITNFRAITYFEPESLSALYPVWGKASPELLLTNFYSFGSFARTVFSIATAAAAAGFSALGAAAAKTALSALLAIVLSPILSPGVTLAIGLFILTAGFETWWSVFIGVAAGMTGREINQAIWDKMGEAVA